MNNELIMIAKDIVKTYASGSETLEILKGISFSVPRGSSIAVTGQSGSGKSTLLNILGGLDRCDSGSIRIFPVRGLQEKSSSAAKTAAEGLELRGLSESALTSYRSREVGFIFQFHYLLKDFTALENVMLPAYIAGMGKRDAINRARALLLDVRLEDRSHHYPSQLSGGERQRVAVARSIINDPDLVLADEPTGNLDTGNSSLVAELLYSLTEKWNKTLMVVTHDEKVAARARFHYVLEGGHLRGPGEYAAMNEAITASDEAVAAADSASGNAAVPEKSGAEEDR